MKRHAAPTPTSSSLLSALIVFAGGAILVAASARHHPVSNPSVLDVTGLALPAPTRLLAMLRTLGWLAAANIAALSTGSLIERKFPLASSLAPLRPIFRVGIGLTLVALAVLTLASLHLLIIPAFAALLLIPPALCFLRHWRNRGSIWRILRRPDLRWSSFWVALAFALLLAGAYLRVFGDDPGWDALTYHLAFPARYLDSNAIFMTPFSHLSGYVANTEMLYLLALALDGVHLAVLINFEFGVLILATVWIYARRVSLRAAILAPLILLADPLFQRELGWAYTDLGLAFHTTLSAIALHAWIEDGDDRTSLAYAGVFVGMACATRYLGASFALALIVIVWLPPRHRRLRENIEASALLAGLAIAVMTPWMLRNVVFTGNPVTPLLQSFFYEPGTEYIRPVVMRQSSGFLRFAGMGRDLIALASLPWNLSVRSTPGTYMNSFGFQVGPLYAVGLFAALFARGGGQKTAVKWMAMLVAIVVLLWFYSFQEARFLIPALPLAAIIGAIGIHRVAKCAEPWGRAVLLLPAVAVLYCQLLFLGGLPADYSAALGAPPDGRGEAHGPVAAAEFLRREMRDGDKLMLWLEERAFYFKGLDYIPYHIGSGSPLLALVHRLPSERALHCGLQQIGVTHVLVNSHYRRASPGLFVQGYGKREFIGDLNRVDNLMRGKGKLLFERDGVTVYRLPLRHCN